MNMPDISVTFAVFQLLTSRVVKAEQLEKVVLSIEVMVLGSVTEVTSGLFVITGHEPFTVRVT